MGNIGYRINKTIKRADNKLVESFRNIPTPNIADNMNRMFCVNPKIKSLNGTHMAGVAFTVKAPPGDNLLFHKALDMAQPGDIIVIDVQGETTNATCGEIMFRYAMKKGIEGFLIDGAVRDLGGLKEIDFPVYAKGVSPNGPYKNGPGEINFPVCCGGSCC